MLLSNKIKYGMQALVYLTRKDKLDVVPARKIAGDLNLPREFVSKILQSLVTHGLLGSKKGKGGGFYMTANPADIKVGAIFAALGHSEFEENCFLGLNGICTENLCDLCDRWKELNNEFESVIKRMSVRKLSETSFAEIEK